MFNDEALKSMGLFHRLMQELHLVYKQPAPHAYKKTTVEQRDIPDTLNRVFDVERLNQIWCGDITYVWARSRHGNCWDSGEHYCCSHFPKLFEKPTLILS